jgi:hypothetical protein
MSTAWLGPALNPPANIAFVPTEVAERLNLGAESASVVCTSVDAGDCGTHIHVARPTAVQIILRHRKYDAQLPKIPSIEALLFYWGP